MEINIQLSVKIECKMTNSNDRWPTEEHAYHFSLLVQFQYQNWFISLIHAHIKYLLFNGVHLMYDVQITHIIMQHENRNNNYNITVLKAYTISDISRYQAYALIYSLSRTINYLQNN